MTVALYLFIFVVLILALHTRAPGKLAAWIVLLPLRTAWRATLGRRR